MKPCRGSIASPISMQVLTTAPDPFPHMTWEHCFPQHHRGWAGGEPQGEQAGVAAGWGRSLGELIKLIVDRTDL